ncbi:MAG: hypothetical protein KDA62_17830, partial [Planctomycetales bacterium]|nr:hypothetical protein [Planctomycetales bacterium]
DYFRDKLRGLVDQFNLSTDDVKDLSIAALIAKMLGLTSSEAVRGELRNLLNMAGSIGLTDARVGSLKLNEATSVEANGK